MADLPPTPQRWFERRRKRLLTVALLALAIVSAALVLRLAGSPRSATHRGPIAIEGDKPFLAKVDLALSLLEQKAPQAYRIVGQHVPRIIQGKHSGMWAYENPPTLEIGPRTADSSTTWLASAIAHDSMHSKLYSDWRTAHGVPVPDEQWTGNAAELTCCQYQLQVLKQIGAPKPEIDWCNQQDGTHPDVNGDGKHDWEDYNKQNW